MKPSRPQLADAGFTVAALIFLAAGVLSYFSALQLSEVRNSATRSFQILEAAARLDANLSQLSEDAIQAALHPDPKFSRNYDLRVKQKSRWIERLRELTDGDSDQQKRVERLNGLVTRTYIEAAKTILSTPQATPVAPVTATPVPAVSTPVGTEVQVPALMESIRDVLTEINEQETKALEASLKQEVASAVFFRKITTTGTVGGFFIMIAVFVLLKRDIRARQRAEEALTLQHELLGGLINHIPEAVYAKDPEGRFIMANHACRQNLTGNKNGIVVGKTVFDFLSPRSAEEVNLDDQAVIRSKQPIIDRKKRTQNVKGEYSWQLASKVPLFDAAGKLTELLCIERDVTDKMKYEDEVKKTPINMIAPSSELLAATTKSAAPVSLYSQPQGNPVEKPASVYPLKPDPVERTPAPERPIVAEPVTRGFADSPVVVSSFAEIQEMIGSAEFARMLITVFLDETPKNLRELEEAVSRGDKVEISRAAHGLKGSLGNFGAKTAMKLAHDLEFSDESGEPANVGGSFELLRAETIRVMESLRSYA